MHHPLFERVDSLKFSSDSARADGFDDVKRICFTIPENSSRSGITRVVANIANCISATGLFEVTVLALLPCDPTCPSSNLDSSITVAQVPYKTRGKSRWNYLRLARGLVGFLQNNDFDLIVVSGAQFASLFFFAEKRLSGKTGRRLNLVLWEHLHFCAGPLFRLEWLGRRLALRRFKGVVAITKRDREQYLHYAAQHLDSRQRAAVFQIYNMTSFPESDVAEYNAASCKIVSAGYLAHIKGYDYLVQVAESVMRQNPSWSWDIYGEGAERPEIEGWIEERGLVGRLNLKGYVENVSDRFQDYAIFVHTARAEGMGMVIIEAQMARLPVVAFDVPCGPSDVIEDGVNGDLVVPFDTESMARAINRLVNDFERRKSYSNHACDMHGELKGEVILGKWLDMISAVVERERYGNAR